MSRRYDDTTVQALLEAVRAEYRSAGLVDDAVVGVLGINRTDGLALQFLARHQKMTAGQFASQLGLTSGAVTTVLDRLERAGYVNRAPDPDDRRKVVITLTEYSRQISELIYGCMGELGMTLMQELSQQEIDVIMRFLKVSDAMNVGLSAIIRQSMPGQDAEYATRLETARALRDDREGNIEALRQELVALASTLGRPDDQG